MCFIPTPSSHSSIRWTLCWSGHSENAPAAVAGNLFLNSKALGYWWHQSTAHPGDIIRCSVTKMSHSWNPSNSVTVSQEKIHQTVQPVPVIFLYFAICHFVKCVSFKKKKIIANCQITTWKHAPIDVTPKIQNIRQCWTGKGQQNWTKSKPK